MHILFAKLRANLSLSSFSWVSLLSLLSLAAYVYNIANAGIPGSGQAFTSVVYLQAISGAASTLVSILCTSSGRIRFQGKAEDQSLADLLAYILLITAVWLTPEPGAMLASCYLSAVGAVIIFTGSSVLQLPIYVIMSASYSLQLLVPVTVISLVFIKSGLTLSVILLATSKGSVPTPASLVKGLLSNFSAPISLHSLALSATAGMNALLPLILYEQLDYAKQMNLVLRSCFVVETIFLGKIIHRGQIDYASQEKSLGYKAAAFMSVLCVSVLALLIPLAAGKSDALPIFSPNCFQEIIQGGILALACSLASVIRLTYSFTYYHMGALMTRIQHAIVQRPMAVASPLSPHYSIAYFTAITALFSLLLLQPTWLFRTLLLPVIFISSLIYVVKQADLLSSGIREIIP